MLTVPFPGLSPDLAAPYVNSVVFLARKDCRAILPILVALQLEVNRDPGGLVHGICQEEDCHF